MHRAPRRSCAFDVQIHWSRECHSTSDTDRCRSVAYVCPLRTAYAERNEVACGDGVDDSRFALRSAVLLLWDRRAAALGVLGRVITGCGVLRRLRLALAVVVVTHGRSGGRHAGVRR